MSLNYDLSAIPEDVRLIDAPENEPMHGIKKGDRIMSPVTNALIWATLGIGIGVIDDTTVDEFSARLDLWQKLYGALLQGPITHDDDGNQLPEPDWGPILVTKDDVVAHKGLSTNVFPMETRTAWVKRTVNDTVFRGVTEPKRRR